MALQFGDYYVRKREAIRKPSRPGQALRANPASFSTQAKRILVADWQDR